MIFLGPAILALALATIAALLLRRSHSAPRSSHATSGTVEMIDPQDLLFSSPTLFDGLPAVDTDCQFANESAAALMHEDDWRQEEFLRAVNRAYVFDTLSQLRSHRTVHSRGLGFGEVFVRSEPPATLASAGLTVEHVARLATDRSLLPLYLRSGDTHRVRAGFALRLPDVGFVYGKESGGRVVALGIGLVGSGLGEVRSVAEFSREHDLLFVDWVRGIVIEPGDAVGFRSWLDGIINSDPDHTT